MEGYSKNNLKAFSENQLNDHETLEILFGNSFYFQYFNLIYKHLWKQFENRLMYKNRELTIWIMLNTKNSNQLNTNYYCNETKCFYKRKNKFQLKYGKLTMESHKYSGISLLFSLKTQQKKCSKPWLTADSCKASLVFDRLFFFD